VYAENSSCDQISSFSYRSHPSCYVDTGFCNVVLTNEQNLDGLFKTVSVRDLAWPPDAVRAICDTMKLCNQLDAHQTCQHDACLNNKEDKVTGFISDMFLTRIAQLAIKHPIISNFVCNLYD